LYPMALYASNLAVTSSNELYPMASKTLPLVLQPTFVTDTNYVTFASFIYTDSNRPITGANVCCFLLSNNDTEVSDPAYTYSIQVKIIEKINFFDNF
jgi:hypothetical protein